MDFHLRTPYPLFEKRAFTDILQHIDVRVEDLLDGCASRRNGAVRDVDDSRRLSCIHKQLLAWATSSFGDGAVGDIDDDRSRGTIRVVDVIRGASSIAEELAEVLVVGLVKVERSGRRDAKRRSVLGVAIVGSLRTGGLSLSKVIGG